MEMRVMKEQPSFTPSHLITILFLLLFAMSLTWAGTTGKVSGVVKNKATGEPLAGANVFIEGTTFGASTDEDGYYFIIKIPPGEYSVAVVYIGYGKMIKSEVRVLVDRTTSLSFELESEILETAEIEVVAERPVVEKDLTASEQVISTAEIEKTWARSLDEIMETQTGVFQGHFRGGTFVESVYMMDNVSMNSGLLSDNYTAVNTSTIQEISILTGGYNAEYGSAQSGIVNIITKEAGSGIHGTVITRMKPAGKYHWGSNFYSKKNYDWTHFDLDYWTVLSQNPRSEFYNEDPQELLTRWQNQVTPDPTQADYAERPEFETEITVYGRATDKVGFLLSGRYKRGINIFPQAEKFNPEFNLQGKLSYKINNAMEISFNGLYGGYQTSGFGPSNFNTIENSQEMAWNGLPQIIDPYQWNKYAILGSWIGWPEIRRVGNFSLKWSHVLNPQTYYEIDVSYHDDSLDKTDRDHVIPDSLQAEDDDEYGMVGQFLTAGYNHWENKWDSKIYSIRGDISSQIDKHNFIKAGFLLKSFDFHFDHFMPGLEGGWRWNLINIFDGYPYEGALYVQDKIEFSGLIVNAGVRVDFFNQNRETAQNMFDPLARDSNSVGNITHDWPGNPLMEETQLQVALAPRVGISHPIGENTVLHFVYGHFYQRPSWNKMFGFPVVTWAEDNETARDPWVNFDTQTTEWQGFWGNPKMGYERTIQYEIGIDQNIADLVRLDITGYYKDASRQTVFREGNLYDPRWDDLSTWVDVVNHNYTVDMIMLDNSAYVDIRGLEVRLDTRFRLPLNFNLSYDLSFTSGGVVGYTDLWEPGTPNVHDVPRWFGQQKKDWNSNHKFKGIANLYLDRNYGPEVWGIKPLSDILVNVYFEYWSGRAYTYHGPDDLSTEPNNKRWKPHYRTNLKVAKGFPLLDMRGELSIEVRNLFNNKDLNMLYDEELAFYHDNPDLSLKERLPKHEWSNEPNEWGWYNIWTNPPRQVYLQLKFDF
jgi:hypothetical protein